MASACMRMQLHCILSSERVSRIFCVLLVVTILIHLEMVGTPFLVSTLVFLLTQYVTNFLSSGAIHVSVMPLGELI